MGEITSGAYSCSIVEIVNSVLKIETDAQFIVNNYMLGFL